MSSDSIRGKTKALLEKYIKSKECIKIEKLIYKNAVEQSKKNGQSIAFYYKGISYSIIGMFEKKSYSSPLDLGSLRTILKLLEENKVLFESSSFEPHIKDKVNKQELLIEPPKIEKGAAKCNHCGSDMVFFFTYQGRSADEAMTTKFLCQGRKPDGTRCNKVWKE